MYKTHANNKLERKTPLSDALSDSPETPFEPPTCQVPSELGITNAITEQAGRSGFTTYTLYVFYFLI
jgi:hypothetical protein